jgi:hypothetical protein
MTSCLCVKRLREANEVSALASQHPRAGLELTELNLLTRRLRFWWPRREKS